MTYASTTTLNRTTLIKLRDAVKAGSALDGNDFIPVFPGWFLSARNASWGDLQAASVLHHAMLPGWAWQALQYADGGDTEWYVFRNSNVRMFEGRASTPARAWLIAILTALIAQEERAND